MGVGLSTACQEKQEPNTRDTSATNGTTDINGPSNIVGPVPEAAYPICAGDTSWSMGQCCIDVYCTDPLSTGDCLEPTDANAYDDATAITGLSLGSGDCLCEPPEGPYSNENAADYTTTSGECCYLVSIAACEGRPL